MRKIAVLLGLCAVSFSSFGMTDKAKDELQKAFSGDYQTIRNVAYAMKEGSFGHDKNPIAGCAFRKLILIVNQDKTDAGDYGNEYVECKALSPNESEQAWKIALQLLPQVLRLKQ